MNHGRPVFRLLMSASMRAASALKEPSAASSPSMIRRCLLDRSGYSSPDESYILRFGRKSCDSSMMCSDDSAVARIVISMSTSVACPWLWLMKFLMRTISNWFLISTSRGWAGVT